MSYWVPHIGFLFLSHLNFTSALFVVVVCFLLGPQEVFLLVLGMVEQGRVRACTQASSLQRVHSGLYLCLLLPRGDCGAGNMVKPKARKELLPASPLPHGGSVQLKGVGDVGWRVWRSLLACSPMD